MLNYDSLKQYQDYLVQVINTKTGDVLEGLLDNNDLSYTNSADIGGSFIAGSAEGLTKGIAVAGARKVAGDLGASAVESNYKTIASTYKSYEGASDTGFSISMHIFPKSESYTSIMSKIAKLTQPDTEDSVFLHSYLYNSDDAKKLLSGVDPFKGNLIHVSIGDWFLATGLFCSSSSHSFTKYVDTNGKPLYMVWDVSFIPYKLLNATELSSWHRK